MTATTEIGSASLLFLLVFGMSATVNYDDLRVQLRNRSAILTGVVMQFIVLPFLGFTAVKALDMPAPEGIILMVVTSSPGGSYSNWWCSMFNADLALSVTMTAISTLMSVIMLPLNLVIYATNSYEDSVVDNLDFVSLLVALAVVISAIGTGLLCSAKVHSPRFNLFANKLGNVAGITLVVYSIMVSSQNKNARLWDRDWKFYLGVGCPCVLGLMLANIIATCVKLKKPERVTVSVECCMQNTGIAASVAIAMFTGTDLAESLSVPLYYGMVEAITLGIYCVTAWKIGWTKAPANESFCVVISSSYEVKAQPLEDINAIEVVLGELPGPQREGDLVFEIDEGGDYADADEESKNTIYGISYLPEKKNGTEENHWQEGTFQNHSSTQTNDTNTNAAIELTHVVHNNTPTPNSIDNTNTSPSNNQQPSPPNTSPSTTTSSSQTPSDPSTTSPSTSTSSSSGTPIPPRRAFGSGIRQRIKKGYSHVVAQQHIALSSCVTQDDEVEESSKIMTSDVSLPPKNYSSDDTTTTTEQELSGRRPRLRVRKYSSLSNHQDEKEVNGTNELAEAKGDDLEIV